MNESTEQAIQRFQELVFMLGGIADGTVPMSIAQSRCKQAIIVIQATAKALRSADHYEDAKVNCGIKKDLQRD